MYIMTVMVGYNEGVHVACMCLRGLESPAQL